MADLYFCCSSSNWYIQADPFCGTDDFDACLGFSFNTFPQVSATSEQYSERDPIEIIAELQLQLPAKSNLSQTVTKLCGGPGEHVWIL